MRMENYEISRARQHQSIITLSSPLENMPKIKLLRSYAEAPLGIGYITQTWISFLLCGE